MASRSTCPRVRFMQMLPQNICVRWPNSGSASISSSWSSKAYDTHWTSQLIEALLASDGLVVRVQNGMTQHAIASVVGVE